MKHRVIVATLALTACAQSEPTETARAEQTDGAGVKLYALDCGRIDMLDLSLFTLGDEYDGRQNSAADMCFLVRHPDGDLMWDAGLPDAMHAEEDGITNGPFHVSVPQTLESQLAALGLTPADIEYFTISHSHFDHVGNAPMFAGSTFLIDKDERAWMFRDEARAEETFGFVAPLESAKTREFDGDLDVFGDGSVVLLDLPGHTPGHKSLKVTLDNEGVVMLTGDLYHLIESRERRLMPKFNVDPELTYASMDRFEAIARETGARVIIQHSLEQREALGQTPALLD